MTSMESREDATPRATPSSKLLSAALLLAIPGAVAGYLIYQQTRRKASLRTWTVERPASSERSGERTASAKERSTTWTGRTWEEEKRHAEKLRQQRIRLRLLAEQERVKVEAFYQRKRLNQSFYSGQAGQRPRMEDNSSKFDELRQLRDAARVLGLTDKPEIRVEGARVTLGYSLNEVKQAFVEKAHELHPDKQSGREDAADPSDRSFQEVYEAYQFMTKHLAKAKQS